ncbi:helicase SNF2 [Virgibacillus phasianinus]|uniref:Helicase SNF2 n=1 Tax=Virgibacillus phasianinus TaxID=2017483 RepID=A0A220U7Q4_9BACI|nr:DEAD/DEAH box helicase [Virgibacillus phasianinus]ASK64314.1 helicase SNF2 [Virgibacillus phasianinus]
MQRLFPSQVYERGLEYFHQGRVTELLYDINYHVWTATVYGSESYFVEVNTKRWPHELSDAYCDCPVFRTYNQCKHIAAVLFAIGKRHKEQGVGRQVDKYQVTKNFIQSVADIQQQKRATSLSINRVPLEVEYICKWTYSDTLFLELKVGEKRRLVVKDVPQFLQDVFQEREHYFTKTFTYNPEMHYFQEEDLEIFELLMSIVQNEQLYEGHSLYRYQTHISAGRSTSISPLLAKPLLKKLVNRNFVVETEQNVFKEISIVEDELPFEFKLEKSTNKELALAISGMTDATYFANYELLFDSGTFYFPGKDQIPMLRQVSSFARDNRSLPIPPDQADVFLSEVVPSLKKVGDVQISENVASEIIQVPLKAKLYIDLKADWITGKLEYHYGAYQVDPFNGRKEEDVLIIRDVEKEQQIMQLIEYANFHFNGKELYIDADEETLFEFLYDVLPMFESYVDLFLTSDIRKFFIENDPIPSTSVRLESSNNLLEIDFSIDGINDNEINQILSAVLEKKRYYRMDNGALLSLEGDEYTSIQELMTELDLKQTDIEDGSVQLPAYRGAQVDALIETKKNYDPSFRKLLHHLKSPEEQVYPIPENLQATLRNYQETGFQWFKSLDSYHLGGILADDMGLGKTIQSIAYLLSLEVDQPHLIVAPSSVLYNWKNECEKFAPDLRVRVIAGSPMERIAMIDPKTTDDVWITSYATLRQDIELYQEITFHSLILDEAQYIKNYATKTSRAIREIKAGHRFALSGTPIENSIDELWAIFQVILPGLMPNQRNFKQLSHAKIAMLTKPFILRRLKSDVLKELPDKIESVHVSELTKQQKELYLGYLRELQQETAQTLSNQDFNKNRMKILAGLTRLRQICCHPSLFIENYTGTSGKLEQLMETVNNAVKNEKRMLIFSQFTSMHDIIKKKLEEDEIDYFYLHGQTPSQERVQMSERFNNGEKSVFLISLKAGGTGLNLTGADTVILYDLWWNPAVEDQATGRAHRFGQKNVVQVIRMVTKGTIEEKIYALQQKKRELIDQVIQPGEQMLSSLSESDIRELLSI